MLMPDVNVLVYADRSDEKVHAFYASGSSAPWVRTSRSD
jgi:hypothetical protein